MYKLGDIVSFTFISKGVKRGEIIKVNDDSTYWVQGTDGTKYPAVGVNGSGKWANIIEVK
jgi:hypothetical protein